MTHLLAELTRDEAGRQVPDATVIMPSAAIEQHGPHLPIITDTCIVEAVSERVAAAASVPVLVAPTVCYGASQHHFPFPGVMSLSSGTFSAILRDLLDSLARMGARRVYLLNGHGGNDELIRLVAREEGSAQASRHRRGLVLVHRVGRLTRHRGAHANSARSPATPGTSRRR